DHDHDHGEYDPHVWVDPVRAKQVVENIAGGLAEVDPDNEDTFEENAAAYAERLDALDERFRELVDDAERRVGVIAGHDSFQYLEDRYGFELHSPTGVSPDQSPSTNDIADTIDFVNEEGIEVILYDYFEAPDLAETIVENSDATEVAAVSPTEGTTEEWNDEGWGYVEQMEEINVPAFEKALGSP
ncbi:metal ABC transporter substrate-binding protein, partial [Halovivax sp.]|uniref:metal ABC transporter substrate-binding protein n=1 Tax=Halovivax sp. TaxID=1935978 RepID=UPI0025BC240D